MSVPLILSQRQGLCSAQINGHAQCVSGIAAAFDPCSLYYYSAKHAIRTEGPYRLRSALPNDPACDTKGVWADYPRITAIHNQSICSRRFRCPGNAGPRSTIGAVCL